MRRISVGDVMTRKVVTANANSTLHDCSKIMAKDRINSLLITRERKLVGILTSRDILWAITKQPGLDLKKVKGCDIASRKLAVIKPSADISQAITKMRSLNFRRLPVMSKGELIGVITLKDILSIEPQLYNEMKHLMDEIKESERKSEETEKEWPLQGLCDNCGAFSDLLKVYDQVLCADCREEMF
jgi:CBS domain-containing protein